MGRVYLPKSGSAAPVDPNDPTLADSKKKLEQLGLSGLTEALTGAINQLNEDDGLANEAKVLTLGAYGEDMDFFTLKGAVEAILKQLRVKDVRFEGPTGATLRRLLAPRPLRHRVERQRLPGHPGAGSPPGRPDFGVDGELYCAELSLDELMLARGPTRSTSPCPSSPPSPGTSPWCATRPSPWGSWSAPSGKGPGAC